MSWVSPTLPERVAIGRVTFVPLRPAMVVADHAAVMRDVAMLRTWSGQDWPTDTFTVDENLVDLQRHEQEQLDGVALTYSVLVDDRVCGCIYVRPVVDALLTREVEVPSPMPVPEHDVAVRGWAHDIAASTLISASFEFLSAFGWDRLWWQTNTRCGDQLAACDDLGLTASVSFAGATATWVLRSVPE